MAFPKLNTDRSLAAAQLVVAGWALLVWWPAFVTTYAMTDDYSFLQQWCRPDFDLWTSAVVKMGRPLAALLARLEFLAYDQVSDLARVRLLSGGCLILFGVLLLRWLVEAGWSLGKSLLTALLILMTPPFAIYVGWAAVGNAAFGAVFALCASQLYMRRFLWQPVGPGGRSLPVLGGSVAAILIAASFYQPSACFFWLLPMATLLAKPASVTAHWRAWLGSVVLFLGSLGLYFVGLTIAKHWIFEPGWATARGALASDPVEKLWTLVHVPGIDILGLWWTLASDAESRPIWIGGLVLTLVALVGTLARARSRSARIAQLTAIAAMTGLTFTPFLAVASNASPFRTLGASTAIWIVFLVGGLSLYPGVKKWQRLGLSLLFIATLWVGRQASIGLREGIVDLHHREWTVLNNLLRKTVDADTKSFVYRIPFAWHESKHLRPYHEFTNPSTMTTWGIEGLVHMHYRERFPGRSVRPPMVFSIYPWAPIPTCKITLVDGYRALSGDPGTPPSRHIWNKNGNDQLEVPPFGLVTFHDDQWIETERMGVAWIFQLPAPDRSTNPPTISMNPGKGVFFFLLCEDSVFWTNAEVYPNIVKMATDQWYRLEEGNTGTPMLTPYPTD